MIGVASEPGLFAATDRKMFKQDATQSGAGTAAASIETHEALQASEIICKLWDMIGVATFFADTTLVHKVIEVACGLSPHSIAREISSTRYTFYTEPGTSN